MSFPSAQATPLALYHLCAHTAPGGKVEALALELLVAGKRVCTLGHPANATLVGRLPGAQVRLL